MVRDQKLVSSIYPLVNICVCFGGHKSPSVMKLSDPILEFRKICVATK